MSQNKKEVCKYLCEMNDIRVKYIIERLIVIGKLKVECLSASDALRGFKILVLGSGCGLLTEVLGIYQAEVVGLESNNKLIEIAREHIKLTSLNHSINVLYLNETIENHCQTHSNHYDVIVCSEVIEHVEMKESLIVAMTKALKPGGSLITTTLNRTAACWFITKIMSEIILETIPRGFYKYSRFITPKKLSKVVNNAGCKTVNTRGMMFMIPWSRWRYKGIDYLLHAIKE